MPDSLRCVFGSLMQEPKPSSRPQGLPGTALAAAYCAIAVQPLLAAALGGTEPAGRLSEFGSGLGLTAAALLLLQFLSSGRYESVSGRIGLDRTMGFHRVAAVVLLAFALLHPLFYVASTAMTDPSLAWQRLGGMFASSGLRSGVAASIALLLLIVLAAARAHPRIPYEIWRASHGLLAFLAGALTLHHALSRGTYSSEVWLQAVWAALAALAVAALLIVYIVRPWRMWREGWTVEGVRRLSHNTLEMVLIGPAATAMRFQAGQFIWLALWPNRPPFHDHPFSIASSPSELPRLRLVVREAGNCTSNFERTAPGTRVAIDGPHGSLTLSDGSGPVVLIAGGVGVAPLLGILEDAAAKGDTRPFRLLYAARTFDSLACLDRLRALRQRLDLSITTLVDEAHKDSDGTGPLQDHHVQALIAGCQSEATTALICGPGPMMEIATDALLQSGVPPGSIHYERFDFGTGRSALDRKRLRDSLLVFVVILGAVAAFALR